MCKGKFGKSGELARMIKAKYYGRCISERFI